MSCMITCILQTRMGSTRLPGKVLMKINEDNSVLDFVIKQLRFSELIDEIIIATTGLEQDDIIEQYAIYNGLRCFRGSSLDVLDRYFQCVKKFNLSTIVRVTSDCPLIDPTIIDKIIKKFNDGKYDYVSNFLTHSFPNGTEAEIFSSSILENTWQNAKESFQREHVTPYIYHNQEKFRLGQIKNEKNYSNFRWSVDKENDLELVKSIISKINKTPILMQDIIQLFTHEPELIKINQNMPRDKVMLKSLKRDKEFQNSIDKNEKRY